MSLDDWPNRFEHFRYRLEKLRLVWIALSDDFENFLYLTHEGVTSAGYLPHRQIKTSYAMQGSDLRPVAAGRLLGEAKTAKIAGLVISSF
jgi:hypothetical protein